jgi:transcriptional regulator with XRE-family HTH domain
MSEPTRADIAAALREIRAERCMSREALSIRTGGAVHQNTIENVERTGDARLDTLRRIAAALRVPLSALFQRAEKIAAQEIVQSPKLT